MQVPAGPWRTWPFRLGEGRGGEGSGCRGAGELGWVWVSWKDAGLLFTMTVLLGDLDAWPPPGHPAASPWASPKPQGPAKRRAAERHSLLLPFVFSDPFDLTPWKAGPVASATSLEVGVRDSPVCRGVLGDGGSKSRVVWAPAGLGRPVSVH